MKINQKGLEIIKTCEGCRLESYSDMVGIPTIGYGHSGPDVKLGMKITEDEALSLLSKDLEKFERGVDEYVLVPITENQFSALVSFSFNLGLGTLKNSTLLERLNNGADQDDVASEFLKWVHAGGKTVIGLVKRRQMERDLFLEA